MSGPPLSRHVLVRTADLGTATRHAARELGTRRLAYATADRRLDARLHAVALPRVGLLYLAYGGDLVEVYTDERPAFLVHIPITGSLVRTGPDGSHVPQGSPSVLSPADPATLRWRPDTAALVVRLDRRALEGELVNLLGRPLELPLRFRPELDDAGSWLDLVRYVAEDLDAPAGLIRRPAVTADLERVLLRGLLLCQPHTYSTQLAAGVARRDRPPHVVAALTEMHAAPEHAFTVESLASDVNVSPRQLQAGFREHLETSPMRYLRHLRLRRVREELSEWDPAVRPNIADVAHRWGFTHLGRFAREYRQQYGELPSQTLRRR